MKIHTPIFILGLLVFVTPFLGFPSNVEMIVISAFGIAIMIISSTIEKLPEVEDLNSEEKTYEEITEEVQQNNQIEEPQDESNELNNRESGELNNEEENPEN